MIRFIRSSLVIARRDFGATVLSKAFIFFLLGPLFPLLLGGLFGSIGARVATQTERPVVAVVSSDDDFARLSSAREHLAEALSDGAVVRIVHYAPERDAKAQEQRLLSSGSPPVRAVLSGGLDHPHLTGSVAGDPATLNQLKLLIAGARSPQATPALIPVTNVQGATGSLANQRAVTAQIGQMLIFFLTLFLAGMVMSQLIEEKSNKIIEVIAAAVPIDAMFVGKLFAMLAASVIGILVWLCAGALFVQMIKHGGVATLPVPAIGWPGFLVLVVVYFAMNYLLIGAIMLTIGAQASSAREVQVLAMPATFGQLLVFALAATAVGAPDSPEAIAAAIFPLSSPMVMLARAAQDPHWWPHLLAFLWQALWVGIILRLAAQLFRKTVLKSGPRVRWWRLKRA
ncbi:MAG TPA: ABC transporter permease [Sphingomicrobium sp.]|jgi:ABC-2 type transport system permease protein|nr:ABC transporter permease [Sphingomicrobium sp.]